MVQVECFSCHQKVELSGDRVGIREECGQCRADLHVCKNCEFYDRASYNECREPQADVVLEKERANFCDYFQPGLGGKQTGISKDDLLRAAENLFKKN